MKRCKKNERLNSIQALPIRNRLFLSGHDDMSDAFLISNLPQSNFDLSPVSCALLCLAFTVTISKAFRYGPNHRAGRSVPEEGPGAQEVPEAARAGPGEAPGDPRDPEGSW